ncbi:hypothetical protein FHG87_008499 [Trinorchestia longiramus]|nr:hypothetical protein FHG87_008499 [Trinorchestia longiramus]
MKITKALVLSVVAVALMSTCSGSPHPSLKMILGGNSMKKLFQLVNSNKDITIGSNPNAGGSSTSSSHSKDSNPLTAFVKGVRASRQADSTSSSASPKSSSSTTAASNTESTTRTRRGAIDFDLLAMIVRVVLLIIEIEVRIFLKLFGIRLPDFGDDIAGFLRQPLQFLETLT